MIPKGGGMFVKVKCVAIFLVSYNPFWLYDRIKSFGRVGKVL